MQSPFSVNHFKESKKRTLRRVIKIEAYGYEYIEIGKDEDVNNAISDRGTDRVEFSESLPFDYDIRELPVTSRYINNQGMWHDLETGKAVDY